MKWRRFWTTARFEEKGSTYCNGRIPPKPHGNGKEISLDAWTYSRITFASLESKGAFSRLSSPVK